MKIQLLEETSAPAQYLCSDAYCAQEKMNGERMLIQKAAQNVTAYNRRGLERPIPAATLALALLSDEDWLIDGEIVGDQFTAFDVLEINGGDVTGFPQSARFAALGEISPFTIVRQAVGDRAKNELLFSITAAGGEGVVFKEVKAPYRDGRHFDAIKYRLWKSESFIVTDHDIAKGSIGLSREGKDCGRCVVKFSGEWPKPGDVVEVKFSARSKTGKCIHPVLLGIRRDIAACEIP